MDPVDRPNFTKNPTSCDAMQIDGRIRGTGGVTVERKSRFQVAECPKLDFRPNLSLRFKGKTKRTANPRLIATLTVLSEVVSADETRDLLAQLPKSVRDRIPVSGATLPMRPIEFVALWIGVVFVGSSRLLQALTQG